MRLPHSNHDTIVAPATPAGSGAIAIVRISGPQAPALLKTFFHPTRIGAIVNNFSHHRLVLGELRVPGGAEAVDQVLAVLMPGPHSYTGEDVAEIHCHGSPAIVAEIVEVLCRGGARPAEPGEFTRRAFENGRIDLAQAEAVCDLVRSATTAATRQALRQLAGELSRRVEDARAGLVDFAAETEARLDFPEDELGEADRARLRTVLAGTDAALEELVRQGRRGRRFRDGARVALVGRPNVGKSSLLNALLGRERAIVSPHPGTTRDTIECTVDLGGVATTLVDTAGWRVGRDEIERLGIERTEGELALADLLLWVVDGSAPLAEEDRELAARVVARPALAVCSKSDLPPRLDRASIGSVGFAADRIFSVSAVTREGLREVEQRALEWLLGEQAASEGEVPLVSNTRHLALLERARANLAEAQEAFAGGVSGELVMVSVREALGALDEILGRRFDEEVLDAIFARFCIGK